MNHWRKERIKSPVLMPLLLSLLSLTGAIVTPLVYLSSTPPLLAQTQSARQAEAERLLNLCREHIKTEQWKAGLESCQQAVSDYQQIKNRSGEAKSMTNLGIVYLRSGQSSQGISTLETALEIAREIGERRVEAIGLLWLGNAYLSLEQSQQGTEFLQRALTIAQEIGETELAEGIQEILSPVEKEPASPKEIEADRLLQQGNQQSQISQYREAFQSWQKALEIYREIGDREGEAKSLNNLGNAYESLGEYQRAIDFYQQSLAIFKERGDHWKEAASLNNLGLAYRYLGEYQRAIEFHQQSLAIFKEIGARGGEANSLNNLGLVYLNLGEYQRAIDFYQQSLAIKRERGDRRGEANSLNNLGNAYRNLGEYQRAIDFYQQSLAIKREIGDRGGEANFLVSLGSAYFVLGEYQRAIDFLQQSLAIFKEIGARGGEANSLGNLGSAYLDLGEYQRAIDFLQQSLALAREIGARRLEANSLGNLGSAYNSLGEYAKASEFHQQSLALAREIGEREGEGVTLSNLGRLYEEQKQPELAIVFYKQSVIVREGIREGIRGLERELQESYTATVAGTYRRLADLLLSQDRIWEAQQVLELLKLQEIQDFTRSPIDRGEGAKVVLLPEEKKITDSYEKLVLFAQELYECELTECSKLSQLYNERDKLENELDKLILELETLIGQRNVDDKQFLTPDLFNQTAKRIIEASDRYNAQPGTVVIYPLVLEDKIWLLWAVKGKVIGKAKIDNVGRLKLNNEVLKLSSALKDSQSDVSALQASANQLYQWLLEPIEREFLEADIKINHLAFSLDRGLRYIPMEVLFDGKEYLIEKYTITTFISAALTDTVDRLPNELNQTKILGLGAANAPGYDPLKHVPTEINNIVRENRPEDRQGIYPGDELLDDEFTYVSLRDNLRGRKILHIATHGDFVPGSQNASYLVLGNGERLKIQGEQSIKTLKNHLDDVHLVVLSGCETAVGEATQRVKTQVETKDSQGKIELEEGVEINALSYYFILGGAKTVMASLWRVDDASTSQLMQRFYCTLAQENQSLTKAEALRKAKMSLLHNTSIDCESSAAAQNDFSHPYYWSPFILIGNGL